MNATKCDRCGQYFDGSIAKIKYTEDELFGVPHGYDICHTCLAAFKKFMGIPVAGAENDTLSKTNER